MNVHHQAKRILVTGGAGFIGSNFIRYVHTERPSWELVNYDALTYAGNPANLADLADSPRYRFIHADVRDRQSMCEALKGCHMVVHCAAENHVDRSIDGSGPFVATNIQGTQVLLDACREVGCIERVLHVGTDEVYGSLPLHRSDLRFREDWPLRPRTPYAASKASSDLLVLAYSQSYGTPTTVTRSSSNFGPFQYPDNVIPLFVTNLIDGRRVSLAGNGQNVRDWLHVTDHCEALLAVLERGRPGEVYNIGTEHERSTLELIQAILNLMDAEDDMIDWVRDCPWNQPEDDRRYAVDSGKIRRELGWKPLRSGWPDTLDRTIAWYLASESWWRPLQGNASAATKLGQPPRSRAYTR